MKKSIRHIFGLFWLVTAIMGCADETTCIDDTTSRIKVNFVDSTGSAKKIVLKRLTAIGNEDGFPEYDNDTTSAMIIGMNPESDYTTLIFEMPERNDTLALIYNVTPTFESGCGIDFYFEDLDTTSTTFDQLEIISRIFDKSIATNVEIVH